MVAPLPPVYAVKPVITIAKNAAEARPRRHFKIAGWRITNRQSRVRSMLV
jgi:hypothetical protein